MDPSSLSLTSLVLGARLIRTSVSPVCLLTGLRTTAADSDPGAAACRTSVVGGEGRGAAHLVGARQRRQPQVALLERHRLPLHPAGLEGRRGRSAPLLQRCGEMWGDVGRYGRRAPLLQRRTGPRIVSCVVRLCTRHISPYLPISPHISPHLVVRLCTQIAAMACVVQRCSCSARSPSVWEGRVRTRRGAAVVLGSLTSQGGVRGGRVQSV